jgi:hypothetical protein
MDESLRIGCSVAATKVGAVLLPGQRRDGKKRLRVAVGDRGVCNRQCIDVDAACDLDQAPGLAVGYRGVHFCCA